MSRKTTETARSPFVDAYCVSAVPMHNLLEICQILRFNKRICVCVHAKKSLSYCALIVIYLTTLAAESRRCW